MYLIGGAASGYGGYLLNVCYQPGKDINYFFNRLDQVMAAPFANYWNETSLKAIILGIFVYVIGMVMYVTSRNRNLVPLFLQIRKRWQSSLRIKMNTII